MINYIEKGPWLHIAISEAGHWLKQLNGVWVSDDDVAVQAIIDAFDPLPYAIADKTKELQREASERASAYYAFMSPAEDQHKAASFLQLMEDFYGVIHPASRNSLDGRLLGCANIIGALNAAIAAIEAMSDWQQVMAYDVVNTPSWP